MATPNADFRKLIPLLHPRTRVQDMDVLKAWYEAVADAFRAELSSDLFALWLFGPEGDPILIEPEALAADHLGVPKAEPLANQMMLDEVETRIRRAGYGSVLLRPVRHGGQDVALVLMASFSPHVYGMRAESLFEAASAVMAPMLARVTRPTAVEEPVVERISAEQVVVPSPPPEILVHADEGALFEGLADAIAGAGTPRDLMLAISFSLQATLPHDCYDLLIPDASGEQYYRIGLHGHGALWGDPSLTIPRPDLDADRLFGESSGIVIDDASQHAVRLPELITVRGAEEPPHSVIGVRLRVVERAVGFLLLGNSGPGFYRQEDLQLLDRVGALLAPRVESLVLAWQYNVLRSQFDLIRTVPMHLARVAELLASTPFLGEGCRLFVQQASILLPVTQLEFAVRLNDENRVAVVKAGSPTPLADLPQEPIDGTGVAAVVRGEVPYLLTSQVVDDKQVAVLVVPVRSGGRIFGAMAMTAQGSFPFSRTDMALAQQLADLAAPHLDLARRSAGSPLPFPPGWKRSSWRTSQQG